MPQRFTPQGWVRTGAIGAAAAITLSTLGAAPAAADEQHKVSAGDTVSALAHKYGTTTTRISAANGLDRKATIFVGQTLLIPTGTPKLAAPKAAAHAKASARTATHTVKVGDTVWKIAQSHGTSIAAIVTANRLDSRATIHVGEKLKVPGSKRAKAPSSASKSPAKASATPSTSTRTHVVASGDTLWHLAQRYGTTVSALTRENHLSRSGVIHPGQKLTVPGSATHGGSATHAKSASKATVATAKTVSKASSVGGTYVVRPGDTLGGIAKRVGSTVSALAKANSIANPSLIRVGQRISVPGSVPTGLVPSTFLGRTYSAPVVGAANQNKATLNAMSVPSRAQMQALVVRTAKAMGVSTSLAQAIAYQESGFNMRAVSPANAIGVMQVIPSSGEWASTLVGRKLNLLDPHDNVTAGVAILRYLTRKGRPLDLGIGGYYQGEAAVNRYGLYPGTKDYVASVRSLMKRFR